MIKTTAEQKAIIEAVDRKVCDVATIAGAGCGKSTTSRLVCDSQRKRNPIYLAFNRAIAEEFRNQTTLTSLTQHSFCLSLLRSVEKFEIVNRYHVKEVAETLAIDNLGAIQVLQTLKNFLYSAEITPKIEMVPEMNRILSENIRLSARETILRYTKDFFENLHKEKRYSHDAYIKVLQVFYPDLQDERWGLICIDEYQDTNHAFIEIVKRHPQQKLLIGDPMQSIYQWRGAIDAFEYYDGLRLPLSVSFRFPPEIAELANQIIALRDPEFRLTGLAERKPLSGPKAYLHRSNIGCIERAKDLLDRRVPFNLIGGVSPDEKAVLADLQSLYFRHPENVKTPEFKGIKSYEEVEEIIEIERQEEGEMGEWQNRIQMIHRLGGYAKFLDQIEDLEFLSRHHQKNKEAAIIITAHKAKGLEYPEVVISRDFLSKFKNPELVYAATGKHHSIGSAKVEEQNLLYVAVTRAMRAVHLKEVASLFPHQATVGFPSTP